MLSNVTDCLDLTACRGSVCNWMIKGARNFSEFSNLGRCYLLEMGGKIFQTKMNVTLCPTSSFPHLSKGVYLQNVVLKFSG